MTSPARSHRLVLAHEEPEHDKPAFAQESGVRRVDARGEPEAAFELKRTRAPSEAPRTYTRAFETLTQSVNEVIPSKSTSSSNIPTRPMRVIKAPPQPIEPYVRNDTPAPLPVPCLRPTVVPDAGRYSFVDPGSRRR